MTSRIKRNKIKYRNIENKVRRLKQLFMEIKKKDLKIKGSLITLDEGPK